MMARAAGLLILVLLVALGVQSFRIGVLKQQIAADKAAVAEQIAAAERRAREAEQLMAEGARKAAATYAQHINRARSDADGARGELDRLRDTLGTPRDAAQDAAAAAGADDAGRARIVVGACARSLQAVAAAADACEAKLTGLQEWARVVAPGP
jgi:hypothetical protein